MHTDLRRIKGKRIGAIYVRNEKENEPSFFQVVSVTVGAVWLRPIMGQGNQPCPNQYEGDAFLKRGPLLSYAGRPYFKTKEGWLYLWEPSSFV